MMQFIPNFYVSIGIVALVNGNKNIESAIEAAYEEIIPAFRNFEAINMPKVLILAII